jgi:hypothetical protein
LREEISAFKGLKVQFIQDEYRWVDEITAMMRFLGIHVLYTCIPEPAATEVYGPRVPGVTRISTLPGYVPESVLGRPVAPIRERPLDLSYRGQTVPFWLGRLGQDKVMIGRGVRERIARHGLVSDIEWTPEERIYGEEWYRFTAASKAALGTESGASIVDFDGSLQRAVDEYLASHSGADFEEVHARILAPHEGNVVIRVVSPRVFEAAALRTGLVLFPGHHSGVVEPWTHYIPLEKDFANFDDVAALLRQPDVLQDMVDRTYDDVVASGEYSLRKFVSDFDDVLLGHAEPSGHGVGLSFHLASADVAVSSRWDATTAAVRRATARAPLPRLGSRVLPKRLAADAAKFEQILRFPPLRRLFVRSLRIRGDAGGPALRETLSDLRKLDIIRRAQRGELGSVPLRLEVLFDSVSGRLTLRGVRDAPGNGARAVGNGQVATAVRRGEVRSIVWDCSEAAPMLVSDRNPWRGFVPSSTERFPALEQLARAAPDETAAALEASLFPRP